MSSRKRGKWFRPRLVALTLLLVAVSGVKDEQPSSSKVPQQRTMVPPAAGALAFPEPPYSFAHRGASGLLPEHSMPAYMLAVEQVIISGIFLFLSFFSGRKSIPSRRPRQFQKQHSAAPR